MVEQKIIQGEKIYLRPLKKEDLTDKYLAWLNDPVANQYTQRRYKKTTKEEMVDYFEKFDRKTGVIFAIIDKDNNKHVGSITVSDIDKIQQTGELSILIGDPESRGKGFGRDAWHLLTKYAFDDLNLRKLIAGTVNPAMEELLIKQGWTLEGISREAFLADDKYLDDKTFGFFKREFLKNQKK